jgi:hypothetical protein
MHILIFMTKYLQEALLKLFNSKYPFSFLLLLSILFSCKKEKNYDINLPVQSDKIELLYTDTIAINTSSRLNDSVSSTKLSMGLAGIYNDPVFGMTKSSFATQIRLARLKYSFGNMPVADSVVLVLDVKSYYGDNTSIHGLKVYEMTDTISSTYTYYSNFDISGKYNLQEIGVTHFIPANIDSTNLLKIKLSEAYASKIVSLTDGQLENNEVFLNSVKGIYIAPDESQTNGSILNFSMITKKSRLEIYYTNQDSTNQQKFEMVIEDKCNRFNLYSHDYSLAPFWNSISNPNEENEADVFYLQSLGGVRGYIEFPNLVSWADKNNVAIVKAELIIPIQPDEEYGPPELLTMLVPTEDDKLEFPDDFYIGKTTSEQSEYFDGKYYKTGKYFTEVGEYYRFNIARHIQNVLIEKKTNTGIYITSSNNRVSASRAILNTQKNSNPIKLLVTYAKF